MLKNEHMPVEVNVYLLTELSINSIQYDICKNAGAKCRRGCCVRKYK